MSLFRDILGYFQRFQAISPENFNLTFWVTKKCLKSHNCVSRKEEYSLLQTNLDHLKMVEFEKLFHEDWQQHEQMDSCRVDRPTNSFYAKCSGTLTVLWSLPIFFFFPMGKSQQLREAISHLMSLLMFSVLLKSLPYLEELLDLMAAEVQKWRIFEAPFSKEHNTSFSIEHLLSQT